jgi:hypothetical protein
LRRDQVRSRNQFEASAAGKSLALRLRRRQGDWVSQSIQCIDIHVADPDRLAGFWQEALGWRRSYDTPDEVDRASRGLVTAWMAGMS